MAKKLLQKRTPGTPPQSSSWEHSSSQSLSLRDGQAKLSHAASHGENANRGNLKALIVVADDLLRESLSLILSAWQCSVVACSASLDQSTLASVQEPKPDLLIIGASNDFSKAADQIRLFKQLNGDGLVSVLFEEDRLDSQGAATLFNAGVHSFLSKCIESEALIGSIDMMCCGEIVISPILLPAFLNSYGETYEQRQAISVTPPRNHVEELPGIEDLATKSGCAGVPRLSEQHMNVLRCLMEGATNKEIARKLGIAETTVKVHLKAILCTLRLRNRTQAATWALRNAPCLNVTVRE